MNLSTVESRLRDLGIELPGPPSRKGLVPVKQDGHLLYVSGHGPTVDGNPRFQGLVDSCVTLQDAYQAARLCGINALASVRDYLGGDLDQIAGVLKVLGLVASSAGFYRQPEVVDGFSDLMVALWGPRGCHARSAVGVAALPGNIPVEVEMIVALKA